MVVSVNGKSMELPEGVTIEDLLQRLRVRREYMAVALILAVGIAVARGDPGTAEFFFCGGPPVEGLPYCNYHSRVAYQPVGDRRRERRAARNQ